MENQYPLWTALVTPFNTDLSVDYTSLERLVREQEAAGNGLLVLGSTGEALNIDLEEKKRIVEFVIKLNPKTPIMVGVGGHELAATRNWVQWLDQLKIQAYLMVTPLYAKPGDEGQYRWFKTLMDDVNKPVMLYNVPGRTGKALSYRAVERLHTHRNFWAIKEASGSVDIFKKYRSSCDNKPVFCGDDGLLPDFANAGSCGLISVASNVWPAETHHYVKQCLNKTFDAKELWEKAANSLFIASNPIPAKRLLWEEKRITHKTMMPPLHEDDLTDSVPVQTAAENVRRWYQETK
jgi:4-hydroxy-tetrahydrodipicolinate synthase